MREKIYKALNKIYGVMLMASFFAGLLPLAVFVVAIIIGGSTGESISIFLYKEFYPWVIACAALAVLIGWITMYIKPNKKTASTKKGEPESGETNVKN